MLRHYRPLLPLLFVAAACGPSDQEQKKAENAGKEDTVATATQQVDLPAPYATASTKLFSNVTGWADGQTPKAPAGFTVVKFAGGLDNPRWIYPAPNGDIFVVESKTESKVKEEVANVISGKSKSQNDGASANRVTLFRDTNGDGVADYRSVFATGLHQPFGMLAIGNRFYIANTDGVWVWPYQYGQTKLEGAGKKIISLPAGGYNNHWTRNIITNADSTKIYVSVGSGSNAGEHGLANETRRANILEFNPDGSGERIYASGLRNPVGMDWAPGGSTLWASVNERDELGDDLVPDYLTSVRPAGFYGWPFFYWGGNADPRLKDSAKPANLPKATVPDVSLGAHTASLGLAFDHRNAFPAPYTGGAFIGRHGSWNRSALSGYDVTFVAFKNGKPSGQPQTFLGGFAEGSGKDVHGRPVGVAFSRSGYLIVADDAANTVWSVLPAKK